MNAVKRALQWMLLSLLEMGARSYTVAAARANVQRATKK
jgi:hypothetical protein